MKKKIAAIVTASVIAAAGFTAFAGCGLFGSNDYEIVSATIDAESNYTRNWVYINKDEVTDVIQYPPTLTYQIDLTFKSSSGKELTGTIIVSPHSTRTTPMNGREFYDDLPVGIRVEGYDDSEICENKELTITITSGLEDSKVNSGECVITTTYSVVHALKSVEICRSELQTDYALNEEFAGIPMTVTYEDDTSEVMDFEELISLPQYEVDSTVPEFDSSSLGVHNPLSFTYQTTGRGNSTTATVYYNVLPDANDWQKSIGTGGSLLYAYEYYKTAEMNFTQLLYNEANFDNVSFGNVNMLLLLTYSIAVPTDADAFQTAMNSESELFFHAPIPAGQTVTVTALEKTAKYYIVDYDCYNGSEKISSNTLYLIYSNSPSRYISVTLENTDTLSSEELALAKDFINLLWFI